MPKRVAGVCTVCHEQAQALYRREYTPRNKWIRVAGWGYCDAHGPVQTLPWRER